MIEILGLTDQQTLDELLGMVASKVTDDSVTVEVGAFTGRSICHFGQVCLARDVIPDMWIIDDWNCANISEASKAHVGIYDNFRQACEDNLERCGLLEHVEIVEGDSIEESANWMNNSIDFLFLDGSHSWPYVLHELQAWLPKMKENSIIGGHDWCSSPYIVQAVREVLSQPIYLSSNEASYWKVLGKGLD